MAVFFLYFMLRIGSKGNNKKQLQKVGVQQTIYLCEEWFQTQQSPDMLVSKQAISSF
jgi:hypothetical protein